MQKRPYRKLVGGLIYLANATRPDIAYAANVLSRFCTDPVHHIGSSQKEY